MIRIYKNLSTKFEKLVNSSKILNPKKTQLTNNHSSFINQKSCQLCSETITNTPFFCNACYLDLPTSTAKCSTCCLPLILAHSVNSAPRLICGECLANPPSFTTTICPFNYEFPIKQIIRRIKYSKQRYWVKALCWQLSQTYLFESQNKETSKPDLLIPIPMHKSKHKQRGYNQAALIAQTLSRSSGIAISKNTLIKTKPTETQAQLNKQERMKNLNGSFNISKKALKKGTLIGKHIALVDDVMTTKATCELASKLLLERGAKQVDIWCLARTPKIR